jgi:predicted dehydrogenase
VQIAIIGCGYVFDHYMECLHFHPELSIAGVREIDDQRAATVASHYGLRLYGSMDEMLADPGVRIVVNLTDPANHFEINRASLLAGKHVYSEKPLSTRLEEARELVDTARERNLLLSSAPCSVLSESAQTLWKAILDGAIGTARLAYAELDDNPIYLMRPEGWTSETGASWPYLNEYEVGCTLEHAGYYLTWLAALFGPAESVTAFSDCVAPDKTPLPLDPPDTPDFSTASITFKSGVVARLTCSIVSPYDHRLQIVGNEGALRVDECWHYATPVYLERFSQKTLNARKARTVRSSSVLQSLFGIGGSRLPLVTKPQSHFRNRIREVASRRRSPLSAAARLMSKRELVNMDFFRGVAEMAASVDAGRDCILSAEFVLHVNELTLAMQNAGRTMQPYIPETTFEPLSPLPSTLASKHSYAPTNKRSGPNAILDRLIARAHKH